jgi:hypothetical protein
VTTNTVLVLQVIISAGGVIASITVSSFVSGTRWGRMETDMRAMADRLAKIEGMFTLRLKDNEGPRPGQ